jgi:hypothetical protein
MVPILKRPAGTNRHSVGWRIEERNVQGYLQNRKEMQQTLKMNNPRLRMKKTEPIVLCPLKLNGSS